MATKTAAAIALDSSWNVYITGKIRWGWARAWTYATVKYNCTGQQQWAVRYNVRRMATIARRRWR
jgi:hypothetical protein